MKNLYSKLALEGLRKNKEIYLPYSLAIITIVFIFTSMLSINKSPSLDTSYGINHVRAMLGLGLWIMLIFALLFFTYVDDYILKRRQKDLGLYNVLGLDKVQIGKVVAIDLGLVWLVSIGLGIILSIVLYNIVEGLFLKAVAIDHRPDFLPNFQALVISLSVFALIWLIVFIRRLIKIYRMSPIDLLNKDQGLEKRTIANIALSLIGLVFILIAYYLANTIGNPLNSLEKFFICVVLVIAGTYMAFGGIVEFILSILKSKKTFYYKTKNFTAIGGLISRIRQNASGLASIAIMSCAAVVLLFAALSLRIESFDLTNGIYPRDIKISYYTDQSSEEDLDRQVSAILQANNIEPKDQIETKILGTVMYDKGHSLSTIEEDLDDRKIMSLILENKASSVYILKADDYPSLADLDLSEGQIYYYSEKGLDLEEIKIGDQVYKVDKEIPSFTEQNFVSTMGVIQPVFIFIENPERLEEGLRDIQDYEIKNIRTFNIDSGDGHELTRILRQELGDKVRVEYGPAEKADFLNLYGGMFFIGIFLALAFFFGTALIIYYKQVTEAYEDRKRYQIYRNVGMTEKEVRISIDRQVQNLFFLPPLTALIHLLFAYQIVSNVLNILGLFNHILKEKIFILVFALYFIIYLLVYKLTSRTYYRIVSQ